METYNSEPYSPKIAVIVNKNPVFVDKGGEQIYQIGVKIGCNNALGCVPSTDEAIMAFNNYVAKVKLNDENCYVKLLKEDPKKPKFGFFSAFIDGKHIVKKVCEKSPAEMAGIQVNDIIVKISDTFMDSQNAFRDYVAKFGEKTTIEIDRNNYQLKANLEFPSEEEVTKLVAKSEFKKTEISQVQTTEEKIESLNRMFEKGLINKDEFNAKKKDLIDKM